jgi:hypothetical protein
VRGFSPRILEHRGFGALAASNMREGDAMIQPFKLATLAVLGAWLLTSTSCEDKVCNDALHACKKESTEQRRECASNMTKLAELKAQLVDTQAKVDSLSKENDEFKAKSEMAEAKAKAKGKGGKAKHKKKGKK